MDYKKEIDFGINDVGKANVKDVVKSIADDILTLLVMRPGDIPSMPHLGVDIERYIYELNETIRENDLKDIIFNQCNDLFGILLLGNIQIIDQNHEDGTSTLLIYIPIVIDNVEQDAAVYIFDKGREAKVKLSYTLASFVHEHEKE